MGAGLAIAAVAVILNLVLPHRMRLIGVVILVVPQIWVSGLPEVELATIAILWTLTTCLAGLTDRERSRAESQLVVITGVFVVVTAISLAWALPAGVGNGASTVARSVVFLLWLREVIVVARDEPRFLDTLMVWCIPGVAIQAVLAIIFRINPSLEEEFLRSKLARVFVGPQAEHLFTDMRNNVLYAYKSGGLYVNGNMASLFGAIAGLLLIIAARRTGQRWLYVFAALSITGAIFTGSKTALVLAPICAIAVIFLPHMLKGWIAIVGLWLALMVPIAISITTELLARYAPGFYAAANLSVEGRDPLWKGAAQLFSESPFLGLGFGGWAEGMAKFTNRPDLPPHNLLVAAWAYSGIVAALAALVFMIAAITLGVRVAGRQPTLRDRRTAVIALCAVAWVFIHGMADNTTIYGEQRSMILVALVFGYMYAMMPRLQTGDAASESGDGLPQRSLATVGPRRA